MIDIIFEGVYYTKLLFIISDKNDEIAKEISNEVKRGVTGLYGKGMYKSKDKLVLICAASRNDGSVNILTSLLEVDDVDVKIAAVTSLGEVGDDHVTALIRQLAVKTPADQTELKAAITKALEKIVERA